MNYYLSIISHLHSDIIINNKNLLEISNLINVNVCIKDNYGEPNLRKYCETKNFDFIYEDKGLGFGENNNYIFSFFVKKYQPENDDVFIVINPDIEIDLNNFIKLQEILEEKDKSFFTIDLYKDRKFQNPDTSLRTFPRFWDFISSYLFSKNNTLINREDAFIDFDWCTGAFQGFKFSTYMLLGGFDSKYIMYVEDIDICYRASLKNMRIDFIQDVRAVHIGQHANRQFFSKAFFLHTLSILRYILVKNKLIRNSGSLSVNTFNKTRG